MFHRSGDLVLPYDDLSQIMPHFLAPTAEGILADVDAALGHPPRRGSGRRSPASSGSAWAARWRWRSHWRDVGAAVTFYGGGLSTGRFGFDPLIEEARLRAPWLGLFGDLDEGIPGRRRRALSGGRAVRSGTPRSSATPTPATASTAISASTTSPAPAPGPARSPGSTTTYAAAAGA